jgi:two-component system, NarL family, nitrate/nitrite response regulator NarL
MQKEKIRIVVADDQPMFRDGLCRLLTLEEDFEVVAQAQDGYQVLDVLQQHEPNILLLDLKMPGLDGLATLQRLQAEKNKARVIVLTASNDKNEFVQAMKLGASGIVLKQTATELLIKSIRKVHAGEIWLDSHTTAAVIRQFVANDEAPAVQSLPPAPPSRERERSPLSQREREIVALVAQGFKHKEMAEKMFISEQTVKNHLHNIFDKLGVSNRLELAHLCDDGLAGGPCVIAGDGQPRLPHRPPLSASAEPPADPYGNWVTEIPSDPKKSDSRRK